MIVGFFSFYHEFLNSSHASSTSSITSTVLSKWPPASHHIFLFKLILAWSKKKNMRYVTKYTKIPKRLTSFSRIPGHHLAPTQKLKLPDMKPEHTTALGPLFLCVGHEALMHSVASAGLLGTSKRPWSGYWVDCGPGLRRRNPSRFWEPILVKEERMEGNFLDFPPRFPVVRFWYFQSLYTSLYSRVPL